LLLPAGPLRVGDLDEHRTAERPPVTDAAHQAELVALEALPRPTALAEPAAGQLGRNVLDGDAQPGRQALDDDAERAPVGLVRGQEPEHGRAVSGWELGTTAEGTGRSRPAVQPALVSCSSRRCPPRAAPPA